MQLHRKTKKGPSHLQKEAQAKQARMSWYKPTTVPTREFGSKLGRKYRKQGKHIHRKPEKLSKPSNFLFGCQVKPWHTV
ncbi:hypothetical protein JTB14_010551 [Gonioctena quinquepunctata]|nr:hypothetical protein JTB14_010551 [Gonioctena quinquepunctata]